MRFYVFNKKNFLKYGLFFLFIILATVLPRLNIFSNQFVMDDFDFIVNWELIRDLKNVPQFFFNYAPPPGEEGIYSPLKTVIHSLNYQFFEVNLWGYHLFSILTHIVGACVVFMVSKELTDDDLIAVLSGVIFAVHPVLVESTTSMTAAVDTMGVNFLLISFLFYVKESISQKKGLYLLSFVFAVLAVFTHELCISLPLLFLWFDFSLRDEKFFSRKTFLRVAPFFIVVFSYVAMKWFVLGGVSRGEYIFGSFYLTMLISLKACLKYILISVFPLVLTHNHMIASGISSFGQDDFNRYAVLSQSIFEWHSMLAIVLLMSLVYLIIVCFKKKPLISFCLGWFFISLIPGLNIIPSNVLFAERYLYPGFLTFSLLVSIGCVYVMRKDKRWLKSIGMVGFSILLLILSVRTWMRNLDWRDEIYLFESAVWANPQSALMKTDLGIVYMEYGYPYEAIKMFNQSLKMRPNDEEIYFVKSSAYLDIKQFKKAEESLVRAISINPDYAEAFYNLAGVYAYWGDKEKAAENLAKFSSLYHKQGRSEELKVMIKSFFDYFYSKTNDGVGK